MRKIATIDVGSNSIRMLTTEYSDGVFFNKEKCKISTRISDNLSSDRSISHAKMLESSDAIGELKKICIKKGIEDIRAFATSALRDAPNGNDFVNLVKENHGIDIKIIDGKLEAKLGFIGAGNLDEDDDTLNLLIDIGGSSTELVLGNKKEIPFLESFNVGAVRYLNAFFKNENQDKGIKNAEKDLDNKMSSSIDFIKKYKIDKIILIGGTASCFVMNSLDTDVYDSKYIDRHKMKIEELFDFYELLKNTDINKRKNIIGVDEKRAEIIFQGIIIMKYIVQKLEFNKLVYSDTDNLEGSILFSDWNK